MHVHPLLCSSFVHSWILRFVKVRRIQHPSNGFTKLVVRILFQDDQIRVGLDLEEILDQIRICPDPLAITSICSGLRHCHFALAFSLLFTSIKILRRARRTTTMSVGG